MCIGLDFRVSNPLFVRAINRTVLIVSHILVFINATAHHLPPQVRAQYLKMCRCHFNQSLLVSVPTFTISVLITYSIYTSINACLVNSMSIYSLLMILPALSSPLYPPHTSLNQKKKVQLGNLTTIFN